jgi:polyisoprenoid-binding protein YceI
MKSKLILSAALAVSSGFASASIAAPETYTIDPVHSSVAFGIRHFVSKVTGKFTQFEGSIQVDRTHWERSTVTATIQTGSIDTDNQKRDNHLKSPDFFDAAKYPTISFRSTAWKKTGENTFDVTGDLTMKDVTKPVVLKVTSLGFGPGMGGAQLSGWEATTTIDKKEWNIKDPAMLDAALGDDVTITINVEAGMKKA